MRNKERNICCCSFLNLKVFFFLVVMAKSVCKHLCAVNITSIFIKNIPLMQDKR